MKKIYRDISGIRADSLQDQLLKARDTVVLDKLDIHNHYELVKEFNEKLFINDCNAIDMNACMATIDQQAGNVIWICYAPPMKRDLKSLESIVKEKVKALFCLGESSDRFYEAFGEHVELFIKIDSVNEGVLTANSYGSKGDVILFSPGSPNYKFFESDVDWNKEFRKAIRIIVKNENNG